jgi:hypothetical protein
MGLHAEAATAPVGDLGLRIIRAPGNPPPSVPAHPLTNREVMRYGLPQPGQAEEVQAWKTRNLRHLARGWWRQAAAERLGLAYLRGALSLQIIKAHGEVIDLGLVSLRVVTTVGCGFIVDAFQNLVELENMKYHGLGTGSTAEAAGDTALVTELTTEYTGDVRATGTTTEASATVYRTVATNTLDGTPGAALREHGIFSASTVGVLLDRTVFAAITLSSGDGLQSTYDLTLTAGS